MPRPQTVPRDLVGEAPFLAAIWAEPDDDLPRLVFADWLEERGDPRAEFIRIQCQLERIALTAPERDQLELREAELLKAHEKAWFKELPRLTGVAWGMQAIENRRLLDPGFFRRGFVEGVRFASHSAFERHLSRLIAEQGVRAVLLPRFHSGQQAALAKCSNLGRVDQYFLSRGDATLRNVLGSPHVGRLGSLNLQGLTNLLGRETIRQVADSPATASLRWLQIYGGAADEVLAPLFAEGLFPHLESFTTGMRTLSPELLDPLSDWAAQHQLKHLCLTEISIRNYRARSQALLGMLQSRGGKKLERLVFFLADWRDVAAAVADSAEQLLDLRLYQTDELSSRQHQLTLADLTPLFTSPRLNTLRRLELHAPSVGYPLATELAGSFFHELRYLELNCGLTDAGVQTLLDAPVLRKLRWLMLPPSYAPGRALRAKLRERFGASSF